MRMYIPGERSSDMNQNEPVFGGLSDPVQV